MSKVLNFIVPLIIYPFDIMVSMGQSDEELKQTLSEVGSSWDDKMSIVGVARFSMNEHNQSVIRLPKIPSTNNELGILQHEIFHCVTYILDRIGIKLVLGKSDEAYSYLIGYLTEQIYEVLEIKRK